MLYNGSIPDPLSHMTGLFNASIRSEGAAHSIKKRPLQSFNTKMHARSIANGSHCCHVHRLLNCIGEPFQLNTINMRGLGTRGGLADAMNILMSHDIASRGCFQILGRLLPADTFLSALWTCGRGRRCFFSSNGGESTLCAWSVKIMRMPRSRAVPC
jgi:hypothetical protein